MPLVSKSITYEFSPDEIKIMLAEHLGKHRSQVDVRFDVGVQETNNIQCNASPVLRSVVVTIKGTNDK